MIRISAAATAALLLWPAAYRTVAAGEGAFPAPADPGQPATAAEARMLAERAKQEIAREEKAWTEETAREKEADARRKQRFSEFSQDRLRLQQALADQERSLKEAMARLEAHQMRERELQARFRKLGEALSAQAKALRPALAAGIPYRLDKRLETVDLLIRDLDGGNISPEEGLNRLWTFEQAERRLAQEAEVYSGDFAEDGGDPVQVKYLRVGKRLMAFSSLDGSKLGVLRRLADSAGARYVWAREKDFDRETRQAVKAAIATAEGKALPGFVPLPVWRSAFVDEATGTLNLSAATSVPAVPAAPAAAPAKAKARKGGI